MELLLLCDKSLIESFVGRRSSLYEETHLLQGFSFSCNPRGLLCFDAAVAVSDPDSCMRLHNQTLNEVALVLLKFCVLSHDFCR